MNLRGWVQLSGWALALLLLSPDPAAQAYCRATTVDGTIDSCVSCEMEGYPIAWSEPSITYVFNENGIPGFTATQVRTIFEEAFARWLAVTCDGKRLDLDVQAEPGTTSLSVRRMDENPSTNVMGYLTQEQWSELDYDRHAFAQTGVRYYPSSGKMAGADVWLNGGIGEFGLCPARGCSDPFSLVDLPNVVTHELGHFFGLAHSDVRGATMGCDALPGDTDKRSLERDDHAGICAIYPPGLAFRAGYEEGTWIEPVSRGACSLSSTPASDAIAPALFGGLFGLVFWMRRRQRGSS